MRTFLRLVLVVVALGLAVPATAQTATELKKELLPKIKKAQADGKDLGQAQEEYNEGNKALSDGLQEEAVAHFKKAKDLMPKD
jgi:outer membrane protein assembly factor BamD (BamD/ComL family)